ncbi:MAG: hypothetical protein NTV06_06015, partial [candidate division Zixibacteria bacterium]|nr:hypothetical protein [candidate division Zixibacteria bacterium]
LEALSSATTDDWDDRKFSYRPEKVMSLKQIAWHTIEHEMRHRGQIFMLMRLQGINPPEV